MSASIPIDCQGRKVLPGTLTVAPYPTAAQKPTTFPNGNPFPAGTSIDPYWRFVTPSGVIAADGSNFPYIGYRYGGQYGIVMKGLIRNPAQSALQNDADVYTYRNFLNNYDGSPAAQAEAAAWLARLNAVVAPNSYPLSVVMADVVQAGETWWTRDQNNV